MQPTGTYLYTFICTLLLRVDFSMFYPYCTCKRQCHKIFDHFFFAKKIRPGPHMNRQKRFCNLFRFRENIRSQSSKIACPSSHWLRRHAIFSLDMEITIIVSFFYFKFFLCFLNMKKTFLVLRTFKILSSLFLTFHIS